MLLNKLTNKQRELFRIVVGALKRSGYEARLVGGGVRDILLGNAPKDIDIATDALPSEVIKVFSGLYVYNSYIEVIPTGLKHGTITIVIDHIPIEITTLRIDRETDGRHAVVEFTNDWKEDARRRDFTFNAMSIDIDGNLYDYFNGQNDLNKGYVCFIGDPSERIQEDYLRILRYYRFICRYNFIGIHNAYIAENIPGLAKISGERIWNELMQILRSPYPNFAFEEWPDSIYQYIGLPSDTKWKYIHKTPIANLCSFLKNQEELDHFRNRLKFDNNTYNILKFLIEYRNKVIDEKTFKTLYVYNNISIDQFKHYANYINNTEFLEFLNNFQEQKLPVTGNDLKQLGYTGKEIGEKLKDLKFKFISSNFELTKEELLKE